MRVDGTKQLACCESVAVGTDGAHMLLDGWPLALSAHLVVGERLEQLGCKRGVEEDHACGREDLARVAKQLQRLREHRRRIGLVRKQRRHHLL